MGAQGAPRIACRPRCSPNMEVLVQRKTLSALSWTGKLFVDNQFECYTLEPHPTKPIHPGHPCIPAARYRLELTLSAHLVRRNPLGELEPYVTPEVMNVPNRTGIRMHIANFPKELLGCTAVGDILGTDMIGRSEEAFDRLMVLLRTTGNPIYVTYEDPHVN